MRFHPEHLPDTNSGENAVWRALKQALTGLPGDAFHRFPVTGPHGLAAYEPDLLLVQPGRAPLVVECKGCRIDDIRDVHGSLWTMGESWHRPQERPLAQARDQAVALRRQVEAGGVRVGPIPALVALPFVTRAAWQERFGAIAGTDAMLFAEDFEPEALRQAIAARLDAGTLDEAAARRVAELIGAAYQPPGADLRPPRPGAHGLPGQLSVRFLRYDGTPPSADLLREAIGLSPETPHTYLVATAALERQRRAEGFGGQHQVAKDLRPEARQPEQMLLLFHRALRHLLGRRVLGRAEERTLIQRAMRDVARTDPIVAAQLHHDVFAWRDVLAEFDEAGIVINPDDPAQLGNWAHPELCRTAGRLQDAYRHRRRRDGGGLPTFEEAARHFLIHGFRPTPVVVLEGFTRLTPLQHCFISSCLGCPGVELWVVQPHRTEQAEGFAAIDRTYADLMEMAEIRRFATVPVAEAPRLQHVQRHLFAADAPPFAAAADDSLRIEAFPHRNDEVAACVDRILAARDDPDRPAGPGDIAIVCSDPKGIGLLLRDEAELRGHPELFALQPRQLLLTPVGRFVLTLYEIWGPDGLRLAPEQFAALLGSGWLGAEAQRSTDRFLAVTAQHFAHCRTEAEWHAALDRVLAGGEAMRRALGSLHERLPESLVNAAQIVRWRDILVSVSQICQRLFQRGERPLRLHIEHLLDEIEQLDPQRVLEAEREVLEAIRAEFRVLAASSSIPMDPAEFGMVLGGLIREREQDEVAEPPAGRVWVVGPEGVDNIVRDTVFFLGVDDHNMPAGGGPPWPRTTWSSEEHVERQRYRFLAVLRAARRRVHLSYARQDWQMSYRPSLYLEEVRRLAAIPDETEEAAADASTPMQTPARVALPGTAHRGRYRIDELAVFQLCPYRFQAETLARPARSYADGWQLEWVARGVWLAMALDRVAQARPGAWEPDAAAALRAAFVAVRGAVRERFSGLPVLSWMTIERSVRQSVDYLVTPRGTPPNSFRGVERGPQVAPSREVALDATRSVVVEAPADFVELRGPYRNGLLGTHQAAVWLIQGPSDAEASAAEVDGPPRFGRSYDAVDWWRSMHRLIWGRQPLPEAEAVELRRVVGWIRRGAFPKNPGEHCRYCPVFDTCMGLKP